MKVFACYDIWRQYYISIGLKHQEQFYLTFICLEENVLLIVLTLQKPVTKSLNISVLLILTLPLHVSLLNF